MIETLLQGAEALGNEYLAWYFWECVLGLIACLPIALIGGWLLRVCLKTDDMDLKVGSMCFGTMFLVGAIILASCVVSNLVKVTVAPRVVLVEQIKSLTK